jgi:hypothetical protein
MVMIIRHGQKPGDSFCLEQTVELREQNRDGIEARCRAGKFVIEGEDN